MSLAFADHTVDPHQELISNVRAVSKKELPPLVDAIDKGTHYPAEFLRSIGAAGAFSSYIDTSAGVNLNPAIDAMSEVAEICGATVS